MRNLVEGKINSYAMKILVDVTSPYLLTKRQFSDTVSADIREGLIKKYGYKQVAQDTFNSYRSQATVF